MNPSEESARGEELTQNVRRNHLKLVVAYSTMPFLRVLDLYGAGHGTVRNLVVTLLYVR